METAFGVVDSSMWSAIARVAVGDSAEIFTFWSLCSSLRGVAGEDLLDRKAKSDDASLDIVGEPEFGIENWNYQVGSYLYQEMVAMWNNYAMEELECCEKCWREDGSLCLDEENSRYVQQIESTLGLLAS